MRHPGLDPARLAALAFLTAALPAVALAGDTRPAMPQASALWHLPVSADGLRVSGEGGSLVWPFYVPPQAAPALKRFQLGYQAAIAVMPEASGITLTMNGQIIGRTPIAAPTGVKTLTFDIPPGIAQPGWNAVGLSVSQRHRVDCSMASTYELWTRIDPASTGFVGGPAPIVSLADLPAVAPDESGATPLHLIMPKDPSPADLGRAVRAVERVALRGRFPHPVVDTAPGPTGITIAVGTTAALAGMPAAVSKARGPVQVGAPMPGGGPLLVFSGQTDSDVDRAIDDFGMAVPEATGSQDGIEALGRQGGLRLTPGDSLSFAEMGIPSRTFSGRLYRESFDIVLPPDAYPADYAEAHLSIDGGYAPGLGRDARLTVRVNGVLDGNLDFNDPGGSVLHGQLIHMPLEPFHPGHNRIEIQAELPARADETCDSLAAIGAKERFLLLGTSRLSLPTLARVAQFPSLSASLTGNMRVTPVVVPRLFLPRTTDGVVSAVATLLANASVGAGAPADALFLRGTPQPGPEPAILIGDSADMPALVLTSAGIDADAMTSAWRPGLARPRLPPAGGSDAGDRSRSDIARLDAWGQRVDTGGGWWGESGDVLPSLGTKFLQSLRVAGLVPYPDRPVGVTGDTSFVVAQGMLNDTPLTIVTGRDDKALAAGAAAMTDPSRLASLDGRAASIEDGSQGLTLVAAHDTTFFRTQGFSIGNDRLIAAGWVSKHAAWYIGAVLLSVLVLGASTSAFLAFGRRREAP